MVSTCARRTWFVLCAGIAAVVALPVRAGADDARLELPDRPVWRGEAFEIGVEWQLAQDNLRGVQGEPAWQPHGLVLEPWSRKAGSGHLRIRTRALAVAPGSLALPALEMPVTVKTGSVDNGDYQRDVIEASTLAARAAVLQVRALPGPAPAGFTGAIGRYRMQSTLSPRQAQVGTSITWTLSISGDGNWPQWQDWPARRIPDGLVPVGNPVRAESADSTLLHRQVDERIVLLASRPGSYRLEPVELSVFDTGSGSYRTLRTEALTFEVTPASASAGDRNPEDAAPDQLQAMPGHGDAAPPLPASRLHAALALPVLMLALAWLSMAVRHAWREDPCRDARRAHRRLPALLRQLQHTRDPALQRRLLREWQDAAARRHGLTLAAPTAHDLQHHRDWAQLWRQADLAVYGNEVPLPQDWPARALDTWRKTTAPEPFFLAQALRKRHFLPLLLLAAWPLHVLHAAHPDTLAAPAPIPQPAPRDWIAHHNLALELERQQRPDEAQAHAAVAWLQQPRAGTTRRLWRELAPRNQPGSPPPADTPGGLATPREWQNMLIACCVVACLAAATRLRQRYRGRKPGIGGALVLLACAVIGTACCLALHRYGPAAHPRAVITLREAIDRQLPLERLPGATADPVLPSTTVAVAERGFLDWCGLRLADGRSTWVRKDALLGVWETADTLCASPR